MKRYQISKYPFISQLVIRLILLSLSVFLIFNAHHQLFSSHNMIGVIQVVSGIGIVWFGLAAIVPYLSINNPSPPLRAKTASDKSPSLVKSFLKGDVQVSLSLTYDKRTRIERLKDRINSLSNEISDQRIFIDSALRLLGSNDYVIFTTTRKDKYVQFINTEGLIRLDLPLKFDSNFSANKKVLRSIFEQNHLYPSVIFWGSQFNPGIWYSWEKWMKGDKEMGEILGINCRKRYADAAQLGLDILKQLYGWDGKTKLKIEVDTFSTGWWNKL